MKLNESKISLESIVKTINQEVEGDIKKYGNSMFFKAKVKNIFVDYGQDWREDTLILEYVSPSHHFCVTDEIKSVQMLTPSLAATFRIEGGVDLETAESITEECLGWLEKQFAYLCKKNDERHAEFMQEKLEKINEWKKNRTGEKNV